MGSTLSTPARVRLYPNVAELSRKIADEPSWRHHADRVRHRLGGAALVFDDDVVHRFGSGIVEDQPGLEYGHARVPGLLEHGPDRKRSCPVTLDLGFALTVSLEFPKHDDAARREGSDCSDT